MTDRIHVLHIDGDSEFAALVSTALERADDGLDVQTATSADEAFDRLESEEFDCILSEYDLPEQTGSSVLETVREERPGIPFILYNGAGSEAATGGAVSAGATEFLRTEPDGEQYELLANRIRTAVDRYRAARQAEAADRDQALVSDVNEALVRATSATDVGRRVCELLAQSGPYEYAAVDAVDGDRGTGLYRVAADGDADATGDGDAACESATADIAERALETERTVVDSVDDPTGASGAAAAAAVPLVTGDGVHGVLVACAAEADAFGRRERELLETVGDNVAHALRSFDVQRRLHDERDRRRALFDNAPSPAIEGEICDGGDSHRIVDVNAAFEETFGREAADVIGRDIADVFVPSDRMDAHRTLRSRIAACEPIIQEVVRETPEGTREFLLNGIPRGCGDDDRGACDGGNDRVADGWYVWHVDISDRKRRERAIEELHATVGALVEARTPEAVADITADALRDILDLPYNGVHLYDEQSGGLVPVAWTDETESIVGTPPTIPLDEGLAGQTYESGEPRVYENVESAPGRYNAETPIKSEMILPLGDHGVFLVGAPEAAAFDDVDVSIAKTLAEHATAVLHRIERESILKELQYRSQRLMESTTRGEIAEVAVETANNVLRAELSGVHLLHDGGRRMELVAHADSVEVHFDQLPNYERGDDSPASEIVWSAFDSAQPCHIDDIRSNQRLAERTPSRSVIVYPLGDHGVFIVSSTEPNAFDETDKTFVEIVATTVTAALDRVDRERELRRRNEHLDEFAGLISHDLRNPLNVAQGRVELAREETDSDHLDPASRSIDRALALLEESLAFAREGRDEADFERIDLADAAAEAWSHLDTTDAALSADASPAVYADGNRLKRLLENLFGNATKHGGDDVAVTVGDLPTGFYVADDGPGIPADRRGDVFEVGYSTDGASTGYGLYIVRRIADAHGWDIAVTDAEGGGARFEFSGVDAAT